jgi:NADH:ubiquinone oxidoreductase subunit 2 (subunit N)
MGDRAHRSRRGLEEAFLPVTPILAVSRQQVSEAGLVLGLLGALIVGWGALAVIRGSAERRQERQATLIGVLLIAAGFAVQLGAFHIGTPTTPGGNPTPSVTASP